MPRALLIVLLPAFRYSDWRSAWILRGVGEKHGPVLCRAGGAPEAAAAPPFSRVPRRRDDLLWAIRRRPRWAVFALSGTLVVAALGFVTARAIESNGSVVALDKSTSAGLLAVSFPSDWRTQTPPATGQLGLTDESAVAPAGPGHGLLVIGRRVTADLNLLPRALLASLPSVPSQQIVTLGHNRFYRYLNLSPRGGNTSESVYALPTTVGTILGVCMTQQASSGFTGDCERALGTLRLTSGTVLPLGPSTTYAAGLDAVINRLNAVRRSAGSQLRGAGDAQAQAKAANALAAAHARAASAITRLNAGTAGAANSALATALKTTGSAYGALALAATRNNTSAYRAASRSVTRATNVLNSAFARLGALGYRVT